MGDEGLELNESHAAKTTFSETGGPAGGPQPETLARFIAELRARGFNAEQIRAIDSAMVAAGVVLVETENAGQ